MDTCLDSLKTLERENGENRCGLGGFRTCPFPFLSIRIVYPLGVNALVILENVQKVTDFLNLLLEETTARE
jgi:hypothetical protein